MGTKYATETISGYNAAPPPDDASTGEDNRLRWSNAKGKLGDPVKTAVENINTKLVNQADESVRDVTTGYLIVAADYRRTVNLTNAGSVNLPDASGAPAGFVVKVRNNHTATVTLGRQTGTDTINGTAGDLTLEPNESVTMLLNNASNGYLVVHRGLGDNINIPGTIVAGGNITAFSDERLKEDIEDIEDALDKVMQLRGVTYMMPTSSEDRQMGVIAQEVEPIVPEVVFDSGPYKAVAYANMVGLLIEAVKELSARVEELENATTR